MDSETLVGEDAAKEAKRVLVEWLSSTNMPADEYKTMLMLCERIAMGFVNYGPVHRDKVEWSKETLEEMADAMVYRAFRSIYVVKE